VHPVRLRTEYLREPLGLGITRPRFSWTCEGGVRQSAYRVIAEREEPAGGRTPVWDSGRVASSRMTHVAYEGTALAAGDRVVWTVQLWDEHDQPGDPGELVRAGLLDASDWRADRITAGTGPRAKSLPGRSPPPSGGLLPPPVHRTGNGGARPAVRDRRGRLLGAAQRPSGRGVVPRPRQHRLPPPRPVPDLRRDRPRGHPEHARGFAGGRLVPGVGGLLRADERLRTGDDAARPARADLRRRQSRGDLDRRLVGMERRRSRPLRRPQGRRGRRFPSHPHLLRTGASVGGRTGCLSPRPPTTPRRRGTRSGRRC
jgi:hypothetical protein